MTTACHAALFGATGLIGTQLLQQLLADESFQVTAFSRRPLPISHPRLDNLVVDDFTRLEVIGSDRRFDVAFSCLGSTLQQAGSKEAFYAIDHDLVVQCAAWAKSRGVRHLLTVSAVGSSANSLVFYNRVKAETERDLEALGLERLTIMKPSLLLGERGGQSRPAEALAMKLMPLLLPLMRGPLGDYRPIEGAEVARAMLVRTRKPGPPGVEYLHWRDMQALLS